jgi:hypothetical protein
MTTIVTATRKTRLDPVTLNHVYQNCTGTVYTTFDTYDNFKSDKSVVNRPVSFLLNTIIHGVVDKVIQVGYDGTKHPLVVEAELCGVDVILYRERN